MSDLTNIKGIGPATVAKLNELDITDLAGLASQDDPAALAELVGGRGVTPEIVAGWINEAKGASADSDGGSASSQPTTNSEPFGGKGDHDGDGKAGGSAPALIAVRINRDFWDANGVRHRAGTLIEVPVDQAFDGVESGVLSRVR